MKNLRKAEEIRGAGYFIKPNGEKAQFLTYSVYKDGWVSLTSQNGQHFDIDSVALPTGTKGEI